MYVDYMLFTVIALTTSVIILLRILSSNMRNQEKGFLWLISLVVCHNIIDVFWGLTYFDKLGMGTLGLQIQPLCIFASMPFSPLRGLLSCTGCYTMTNQRNGSVYWHGFLWQQLFLWSLPISGQAHSLPSVRRWTPMPEENGTPLREWGQRVIWLSYSFGL